jgi:hypothetical protein
MLSEVDRLAEQQSRVEVLKRDAGSGECLNQGALDGAQLIPPTEIATEATAIFLSETAARAWVPVARRTAP